MSKFESLKVSARATKELAKAKVHNLAEEAKTAKNLTEQQVRIEKAVKEQESRDNMVLRIANEIEKVNLDIDALLKRKESLETDLRLAKAIANDPTTLKAV